MADRVSAGNMIPEGESGEGGTQPDKVTAEGPGRVSVEGDPTGGGGGDDNRPDWLPAKFKTPADMAKAYKDLEKKMGSEGGGEADPQPEPQPAPEGEGKDDDLSISKPQPVTEEGIDWEAIDEEYQKSEGKLSDETLTALEEQGIPRDKVGIYLKGLEATVASARDTLTSVVGGDLDTLKAVLSWAADNADDDLVEAYNEQYQNGNFGAAKGVLRGIVAEYENAHGSLPKGGKPTGAQVQTASGVKPFANQSEMIEAINDPRYGRDKQYSEAVAARIGASGFLGEVSSELGVEG